MFSLHFNVSFYINSISNPSFFFVQLTVDEGVENHDAFQGIMLFDPRVFGINSIPVLLLSFGGPRSLSSRTRKVFN